MQSYKISFIGIGIYLALFFAGCKKDKNNTSSSKCPAYLVEYTIDTLTPPNTGRLTLTVYDKYCDRIPNTWVIVYATYQDYENDIRLNEGYTNNSGYIDFSYLNAGNYYLYIQPPMLRGDTNVYYKVEVAQVQYGMKLSKRVIFDNYDRPD